MTEFIGSRISLISKRDIRYVGTLHEINSENSTVALEQVVSYGTEGRRPNDEVPASTDNVYEYIVFRGSDVKDLRIEEGPKENAPPKPRVPDDPAILGSTRKPAENKQHASQPPPSGPPTHHVQRHPGAGTQGPGQGPQSSPPPGAFSQGNYPYNYPPPHNQRFGGPQQFPPPPYGFPPPGPGPWGPMPGWAPPQGFPQMPPGQFPPQMPIGPPGQGGRGMPPPPPPPQNQNVPTPSGSTAPPEHTEPFIKPDEKHTAAVRLPTSSTTPIPLQEAPSGPSPGLLKTDNKNVTAPSAPQSFAKAAAHPGNKGGRIVPAVPKTAAPNGAARPTAAQVAAGAAPKTVEEANRDARAAVAAAMAKLPTGAKKPGDDGALDNLAKKVSEMRTNEHARSARQQNHSNRGARGSYRGGRQPAQKIEIPTEDYDFESANAKFNKQDLVKEAIASGSPIGTPVDEPSPASGTADAVIIAASNGAPPRKGSEASATGASSTGAYNRKASFFDDISSEIKDRAETHGEPGNPNRGREFRHEERQKNMETFGQGSVDGGYRYRGRGRGRGRGYGGRGRGRGARGRGIEA